MIELIPYSESSHFILILKCVWGGETGLWLVSLSTTRFDYLITFGRSDCNDDECFCSLAAQQPSSRFHGSFFFHN